MAHKPISIFHGSRNRGGTSIILIKKYENGVNILSISPLRILKGSEPPSEDSQHSGWSLDELERPQFRDASM
jgi:hypothetical protein